MDLSLFHDSQFSVSRQAIYSVLNDRTITTRTIPLTLELSESKWELLEHLIQVLEPFNLIINIIIFSKNSNHLYCATNFIKYY